MPPRFADPKTDFVFKRLFGTEVHKPLLIALLNDLLELDEPHSIASVELLSADQRPRVQELEYSIVDVKCVDAQGTVYLVEMQVLNVEGFEKRVVYNVAKAYTAQLGAGQAYPVLDDVVGVTICDFEMWPGAEVPMLSRWRMQEQHGAARGLSQIQFVFLELPKLDISREPRGQSVCQAPSDPEKPPRDAAPSGPPSTAILSVSALLVAVTVGAFTVPKQHRQAVARERARATEQVHAATEKAAREQVERFGQSLGDAGRRHLAAEGRRWTIAAREAGLGDARGTEPMPAMKGLMSQDRVRLDGEWRVALEKRIAELRG